MSNTSITKKIRIFILASLGYKQWYRSRYKAHRAFIREVTRNEVRMLTFDRMTETWTDQEACTLPS